jgi:TldD protein
LYRLIISEMITGKSGFAISRFSTVSPTGPRITAPVKGATIIGSGADALTRISMVGNDMALDTGIGTCGKNGQAPVGVGQPTQARPVTVGGTAA